MRSKLNRFSDFANGIFPHEAKQLSKLSNFEDAEKCLILNQIVENSTLTKDYKTFDYNIDKRKYSYIKAWCQSKLDALDMDNIYLQLANWEYEVMTDAISTSGEKDLLKLFKSADPSFFNFMKLYDIGRIYRHYLQIRLRKKDFQTVLLFLNKHRTSYEYARLVNDKLHQATDDIIAQYFAKTGDTTIWEEWLEKVYYDESLDGYNRILAWIRLIFIGHNYRKFNILKEKFDYFETMIENGKFYSRRILANFYSQNVLYYASEQDFEKAAYFGYLSVKEENNDYLYYVNNLAAILLRLNQSENALDLLRSASDHAKIAFNYHNKIGHTAYLILAYIATDKWRQAENHADVFFNAYKNEIFEYRWHLFFSAYMKVILFRKNYRKIIRLYKQHQLKEKDGLYQQSPNYTPTIPWIYFIAAYLDGMIPKKQLHEYLTELLMLLQQRNANNMRSALINLTEIAVQCIPAEWAELKKN